MAGMQTILLIASGGAIGALLRYGVANAAHAWLGRSFPWGTLTVNVLGSLLIGLLYVLLVERLALGPEWRAALLIGVLGAFTTFSAFSLETLTLLEEGGLAPALANIGASVFLCLLACFIGLWMGRQL